MALSPAQLAALKADIIADGALNAIPNSSDGNYAIAAAYNLDAAPVFTVWRSTTPADDVFNGITWANLTPNDAPDASQAWLNRALACQGKQFNVQTMLSGRTTVASGKINIRAGFQDALTNVPSGAAGAAVSAGWVTVRDGMKRNATRAEKLFATGGNGAFATPADLVLEGRISLQDVTDARNS
jgi:hypothetical protein